MDIVLTGMLHLSSKWVRTLAFHPALTLGNSLGKTELKDHPQKTSGVPSGAQTPPSHFSPSSCRHISLVLPKGRGRLFTVASMGEGEN